MASLATLMDRALPLNRKERYYTGSVLPQLICADDFAHFTRFADLVGAGPLTISSDPSDTNIQLFAEYGFAESAIGSATDRFPDCPTAKDTPDLLVFIDGPRPHLIAVEAKMYHRPTAADMERQLAAQRTLLTYLAGALDVSGDDVHHVALLPAPLAAEVGGLSCPTVTWEAVLETYQPVASRYWCEVLRLALERYPSLRSAESARTWGANAHSKLTGGELLARWQAGDRTIVSVGRNRGLHGPELGNDIATGRWRTRTYECRHDSFTGSNWFPSAAFVAKVQSSDNAAGRLADGSSVPEVVL